MNFNLPPTALKDYSAYLKSSPEAKAAQIKLEQRLHAFRQWSADRLKKASRDDLVALFSPLWSLAMWGNKAAYADQIIEDNGLELLRSELAELVWGSGPLPKRWDTCRENLKRVGPAMMSELLAHAHPDLFLPWNSIIQEVYLFLQIPKTPKYAYQLDGQTYERLCTVGRDLLKALQAAGLPVISLLDLNEFIFWLSQYSGLLPITPEPAKPEPPIAITSSKTATFLHNDVRDKLADIGRLLGLHSQIEVKVADGAVVDTIWEATIGNMGRVIYVFEVQTGGSIDSLILNLLKSLNNPAVQGVVAVSDAAQLAKIKAEAAGVPNLKDKLKYWDYTEVLQAHQSLESVNQTINRLGLVPQGF